MRTSVAVVGGIVLLCLCLCLCWLLPESAPPEPPEGGADAAD